MSVLVCGGAGYIGSHVVNELIAQNIDFVVLDSLEYGHRDAIKGCKNFYEGNIGDSALLDKIFTTHNIDTVMHLCAYIEVGESVINPAKYYENNVSNSITLLNAMIRNNVSNFVFSSTAAVYGEPKVLPVREDNILSPINPYGSSKMMSEIILRDCANAYRDFNFVALRYFNVAGALSDSNFEKKSGLGQRNKNATHLIKVACECAVGKRESISIFGDDYDTKDGSCIRDYIHIDDLALAHLSAYEFLSTNCVSEVFNVGYGNGYSVKEVINVVKEVSGVDFKVLQDKRRDGDPANLISDNAKILNLTNWKPKYNDLRYIVNSAYLWEKSLKDSDV